MKKLFLLLSLLSLLFFSCDKNKGQPEEDPELLKAKQTIIDEFFRGAKPNSLTAEVLNIPYEESDLYKKIRLSLDNMDYPIESLERDIMYSREKIFYYGKSKVEKNNWHIGEFCLTYQINFFREFVGYLEDAKNYLARLKKIIVEVEGYVNNELRAEYTPKIYVVNNDDMTFYVNEEYKIIGMVREVHKDNTYRIYFCNM